MVAKKTPASHPFFWLATLVLVVAILALAREVLVPLALAVLIAFALTPAVRVLERRLGRGLAVALVVLVGLGVVGAFGYLFERQLVDLSTQMSRYSESMRRKVAALRPSGQSGLGGLSRTLDKLVQELEHANAVPDARPVRVIPREVTALERFEGTVVPALKPAADFVVVLVLVVFLLMKRGDLRDRFIRLAGRRHVSLTTRTLDEAGQRISRFLLVQSAINGGFGVAVAVGLAFIGVPYAPLWGFLAAVLRFVPFIGSLLGMLLPAALAFAQMDGWWHTGATMGLFVGLDLVVAYVIEPMTIGHRTGVSSLAMIVMAVFWTWLWGPLGLVLSTPLTVCLAVLGRQVPRLEFLAVLLGDETPLEPEITFYQRLLAGDEDEAAQLLEERRGEPREQVFDSLIVPALHLVQGDQAGGKISDGDHDEVLAAMRALVAVSGDGAPAVAGPLRILGVPGRNAADQLAWEMLTQALGPAPASVEAVGEDALVSEVVAAVARDAPDLVCITSVAPGGSSHVRLLCRRLQQADPEVRLLVLRLDPGAGAGDDHLSLAEGATTAVVASLAEARLRAEQLLLLARSSPRAATATA
jgi:predicted PurR-regulated permease PerM